MDIKDWTDAINGYVDGLNAEHQREKAALETSCAELGAKVSTLTKERDEALIAYERSNELRLNTSKATHERLMAAFKERDTAIANAATLQGCVERLQAQDHTVHVTKLEPSFEEYQAVKNENERLHNELRLATMSKDNLSEHWDNLTNKAIKSEDLERKLADEKKRHDDTKRELRGTQGQIKDLEARIETRDQYERELEQEHRAVLAERKQLSQEVASLKGELRAAQHTASAAVDRYRQLKDQGAGPASRRELKRMRRRLAAYAPLLAACRRVKEWVGPHSIDHSMAPDLSPRGADVIVCLLNAFAQATSTNLPPVASDDWLDRFSDAVDRAIKAAKPILTPPETPSKPNLTSWMSVVFDGPPSHESGRFVEVEDDQGHSINAGQWHDRGDGMWELRIPQHSSGKSLAEAWAEIARVRMELAAAQRTIADMHAAAVGEVRAPIRGVVEDVADVRAKLVALEERSNAPGAAKISRDDAGRIAAHHHHTIHGSSGPLGTPSWAIDAIIDAYAQGSKAAPAMDPPTKTGIITGILTKNEPGEPVCTKCGSGLMFSARVRGNGLCGPCNREQPIPTHDPSKPDIWAAVIDFATYHGYNRKLVAAMRDRRNLGIQRYGTPLQAGNGRDAKRDLCEELLDATAYAAQDAIERSPDAQINAVLGNSRRFTQILDMVNAMVIEP